MSDAEDPESRLGTVLVIDDDLSLQKFLGEGLTKEGYRVIHAYGGEEGIERARDVRPDVITLDIIMPGTDGWVVLTRLKADPELRDIPVILVTVRGDAEMGIALGAADYLTKPVDLDALVATVRRMCASKERAEILVVDDDESTRTLLRRVLSKQGWEVVEAKDGRVALDAIDRSRPDVILLDLLMPVLDGFEVMKMLDRDEKLRDIPVIILTAVDLSKAETDELSKRAEAVFIKGGYDRDQFLELVRHLIERVDGQQNSEDQSRA